MRTFVISVIGFAALVAFAAPRGGSAGPAPEADAAPKGAAAGGSGRSAGYNAAAGETVLARAADGHFYADMDVNGRTIRFLVDTGAGTVALTRDDAMRAGISFDTARFRAIGTGASGQVKGQPVLIRELAMGGERATHVPAVVLDSGLPISLLGQSFLARFDSVRIEGDRMVLR
jgi:aspartyl protease family protein